jgi:hypothetical protein
MTTQYERIKTQMKNRMGRPALDPQEKERRHEIQKAENRRRAEARRRAYLVLQHKYEDEFKTIFNEEYSALESDKRFVKTV